MTGGARSARLGVDIGGTFTDVALETAQARHTIKVLTTQAKGRAGGQPGAAGRVALASGKALHSKGQQTIPVGDRLVLDMPGGGGFGEPKGRDPAHVAADVADGLVSREAAREVYGVVVTEAGEVDEAGTVALKLGSSHVKY